MSEEKKENFSLSDLGLEEELTPAERSEQQVINAPLIQERTIIDDKTNNAIEVKKSDIDMSQFETGPKKAIPRPDNITPISEDTNSTISQHSSTIINKPNLEATKSTDANANYKKVNIADIAQTYHKEGTEEPVKRSLNELKQKVDEGIERTISDLISPTGRIAEGKRKYVLDRYETLIKRAKESPNLMKKIKFYEDAMDEDPAFDGADEYERKGYILFKVAKDDSIGIDDKSFGLAQESISGFRESSASNAKKIDKVTNEKKSKLVDDDEDVLIMDEEDEPAVKKREPAKINIEDNIDDIDEDVEIPTKKIFKDEDDDDTKIISESDVTDEPITLKSNNTTTVDEDDAETRANDAIEEEYGVTSEEFEDIRKDYFKQARELLNLETDKRDVSLDSFTTSTKTLSFNELRKITKRSRPQHLTFTWALPFTGIPVRMTPFSGEELVQFLSDIEEGYNTNQASNGGLPSIDQLTSIWGALYNHIEMENKPSFYSWLRKISSNDFASILFTLYGAMFKDTNYLTYRCTKKGCAKLYLEKHDIMEMIKYPNDKIKERIEKILNGEAVESNLYRTEPIPINDIIAISFRTPSIYSTNFEQACLPAKFRREHITVVSLMPAIDRIYVIDKARNQFLPVEFGVVKDNLEKTVRRKVKILEEVFSSFTLDQRNIILSEFQKITDELTSDDINYVLPASKCPVCGTEIPESETNIFTILFIRARLSIDAASTRV